MPYRSSLSPPHKIKLNGYFVLYLTLPFFLGYTFLLHQSKKNTVVFSHGHAMSIEYCKRDTNKRQHTTATTTAKLVAVVPYYPLRCGVVKACETETCENDACAAAAARVWFVLTVPCAVRVCVCAIFYDIVYGVCYITHVVPGILGCHNFLLHIYSLTHLLATVHHSIRIRIVNRGKIGCVSPGPSESIRRFLSFSSSSSSSK